MLDIGVSLAFGIVVTVPIGFLLRISQKIIQKRKQQKNQVKNEKDFLDQ
jgi:uncharacterized membrane-anchored protein YhcB (DUF1043 family)